MHHKLKTLTLVIIFFSILPGISSCRNANLSPLEQSMVETPPTSTETPTVEPATETPTSTVTPTLTASPTPVLPTPTATPVAYGPDNFPLDVNPLTGKQVTQTELLDRRPVAVKINLVPRTSYRPTWGLSLADIVWDYYHNDGYSRLHAIFYGNDAELAGAIRSGRLPDHDLVQMYKSVFTYGSADALINFRLLNASYSDRIILEGQRINCPPTVEHPLCRVEPQGPDLLLTGTHELSQHVSDSGVNNGRQNLDGMTFHSNPPDDGNPATQAIIHYSIDNFGKWEYDPSSGSYWLSMDSGLASTPSDEIFTPLLDQVTEEQISTENVVIIVARHQYYQPPPNEIIEILLNGTGKAYALRDGMVFEVEWNRPTTDSVLFLTFPDGRPYPFKPGKTWFHIIGETSQNQEVDNAIWRFDFRFP